MSVSRRGEFLERAPKLARTGPRISARWVDTRFERNYRGMDWTKFWTVNKLRLLDGVVSLVSICCTETANDRSFFEFFSNCCLTSFDTFKANNYVIKFR